MKTRLILAVVIAAAVVAGCKEKEPPCVTDSVKKNNDGKITECVLEQTYEIGGVKCASRNKIMLHPDGSLQLCDLAEPVEIQGFACKSGSVSFNEKGKVYFCSETGRDIKVGEIVVPEGSLINPFGSGMVKYAECRGEKKALYKELTCGQVYFDDSGKLTKCLLAADVKWKGKNLTAGTMVEMGSGD